MDIFVSIGAEPNIYDRRYNEPGYIKRTRDIVNGLPSRTVGASDSMLHSARDGGKIRFQYSRFAGRPRYTTHSRSIPQPAQAAMDEWKSGTSSGSKTLQKIELAAAEYLAGDTVQLEIQEIAELLVCRRRLRTRDKSKWDRFASASWYTCPYNTCSERRHDTLEDYRSHFLQFHPHEANRTQFDAEAQHARRCWLYKDNNDKITTTAAHIPLLIRNPIRDG